MNINLRQLQAFVGAYRLGSLTRAAEQMFITQPAASVLIRQLEASIGVRLFDRTTRSMRPTAAAHESIGRAERILREFGELERGFDDVARRRRGRLEFGATPAVASSLAPAAMVEFRKRYPGIDVTLHDIAPEDLIGSVVDETVELSIGTPRGPTAEITMTPLINDRMCVISIKDSPLARRSRIPWSEITTHPAVTVKKGSGIRAIIDDTMTSLGLAFEPAYEVSYLATALSLTQHGLGISVLPSYLTRFFFSDQLAAIPLVDPVVTRNLSVITRKGASLSPAAESFIEILQSRIGADARVTIVPRSRRGRGNAP
ncbi:MAG: LysR family transcriptional regulator [Burkholderiales bacterium]|nr:LysR family transcriptional regulator [Rhodocyclaceae bacterium]